MLHDVLCVLEVFGMMVEFVNLLLDGIHRFAMRLLLGSRACLERPELSHRGC
jgi:hypothetical protein